MFELKQLAVRLCQIMAAIAASSMITEASPSRAEITHTQIETIDEIENNNNNKEQMNNVHQMRDVSPQDWAYEALRGLVERYGCIVGYPNQTFQGERSLTRQEFAAGLNSCLQQIEELVEKSAAIQHEDIDKLKKLAQEFDTELAALGYRIDNLENRITFLEDHQFSTTSKLFGNVVIQAYDYFSGESSKGRPQAAVQYNLFLALTTSFTGKDTLLTAFAANNAIRPDVANTNDGRDVGSTREGTLDMPGDLQNIARIINLEYQFPITEKLRVDVVALNRYNFAPTLLPQFVFDYALGRGPVSSFAAAPPIYLIGAGSGLSVSYQFAKSATLSLTYLATFANDPEFGIFKGDYVASAQINYNPTSQLFLQLVYQNGYFGPGNFGFNNGQSFRDNGFVGTGLANRFDDAGVLFDEASAVSTNAYQFGGYYVITPKISLGGWVNLINARLLGKGDAEIWTYSLQAAFPDLFKEGNQGGLVLGMEPSLTGLQTGLPHASFKNDTSLHIEAYYRHQINNNISLTPYLIWITAPNQDADNEDIVLGGLRSSFSF